MVVLEHATVGRVGDVEILCGGYHVSVGPAQRVGASRNGAARRGEAAMAEYEVGVRIAGAALAAAGIERCVVLQHAVVGGVRDVEVADTVGRDACWLA